MPKLMLSVVSPPAIAMPRGALWAAAAAAAVLQVPGALWRRLRRPAPVPAALAHCEQPS